MLTSFKNYWKNYFNFSGIAKRKDMWSVLLFNFIIILILGKINSVLSTIYSLVAFIPTMSLSVRRLRDGGHSALPLIIVYILDFVSALLVGLNYLFSWIPVVGWITTFIFVWLPSIVIFCASIYLFILLYCQGSKYNGGFNNYNGYQNNSYQNYNQQNYNQNNYNNTNNYNGF